MAPSVNFEILHSITGEDLAVELELLGVFMQSVDEEIRGLEAAYRAAEELAWKHHAHALKGVAMNLGAEELGQRCRVAQEYYKADGHEKDEMFMRIEAELSRVREEVKQRLEYCRHHH